MVVLHRVLCVVHFALLCVALGLNSFASVVFGDTGPAEDAGLIGLYVASVVSWTTPAFLLAANAGNAGFTRAVKALTAFFFVIVEIAIFLTFWIGYSPVFYNPVAVSSSWVATQIAALVFITLDFVCVLALLVLTFCTSTATSLDTTRKTSGVAVIALVVEIICLGVILGIFYIWMGVLEGSGVLTTPMTTTAVNATATAATTTPVALPDLVLSNVGHFVGFALWTSPGALLVIRSREGGMLSQDMLWNVVSIVTQTFNLVMAVFVALGSKAHIYAAAAIAVSFGCFYALDLILLFVLTFKHKAKEESWDRSSDYMYQNPR